MTEQFGICKNSANHCTLALAGKPIPITGGVLDCPECGEILTPYKQQRNSHPILVLVGAAALLILISVGFFFRQFMPERPPEITKTPTAQTKKVGIEPSKEIGVLTTKKPRLAVDQCTVNSVKIDARVYSIGQEYDHFLEHYKDRYKADHGGDEPLEIDIKHAFCLQQTEVSVDEFKQFLNAGPAAVGQERLDLLKTRISIQKDTAPVQNVSKEDAEAYAVWLSEQTGQLWQLPTLGQWMVAVTVQGEQSPVTETLDNEPASAKGEDNGKVQNLLGNLREWSRDECPDGRYQLLGRNYIAGGVDMAYCNAPTLGAPGVGFRLVYQLDGE